MCGFTSNNKAMPLYCISIIIIIIKNKYTEKLEILTRVGIIVDQKKVLKQVGVVHDSKLQ